MERGAPLLGRTALVTGAARRLGRAIAMALANAGADVVIHCRRSLAEAESLAEDLAARGRRAWVLQADLADPQAAEALMGQARAEAGTIDILVNNASIFPEGRLQDITADDISDNVGLHAVAPLLLSRSLAAQGRPGHIINLLDCKIVEYDEAHAAYQLSKRMLFSLTRMLALELAPAVAVNAVAPGLILGPEGAADDYLERLAHTNPMQRYGSPGAITDAVLFLLASDFITGQVIFVDGGRHLKGRVYG